MCDISNLTPTTCMGNPAGVKGLQYTIPAEEITTQPGYLTTTGAGDSVTLDGDFVLSTATVGKGYWRSFPCLLEKGSYTCTAVGGLGSKSFEEKFTFFIPGIDKAQLEHAKNQANMPGVWLCTDKNNTVHVLGSKDDPAYVESIEGTTGAAAADERGLTIVVRAITATPTVYEGIINTTPAD